MLTLNNLTPGERYEIQLWTNDCRIATSGKNYNPGKTTNIADLGGMVKLEQNSQKAAGGTGQYVTGMFIASGTSKTLTLAGSNPDDSADSREAILPAYQLRKIGADKTALSDLVAKAEGSKASDYEATSWESLEAALGAVAITRLITSLVGMPSPPRSPMRSRCCRAPPTSRKWTGSCPRSGLRGAPSSCTKSER